MEGKLKYKFDIDAPVPDVASSHYQRYTRDNGIDTSRTVQFRVEGQPDCFINLGECYLKTIFRLVKEDGTEIGSNPQVFPAENYGSNLWSQVDIRLNNTPLPPGNDYPYTGYLIDILGSSSIQRAHVLETIAGTWIPSYGSSLIRNAKDKSYRSSKDLCKNSKEIIVYSRIHSDFMTSCSQFLPNNMDLDITLQRSKDAFVLGGEIKYSIDPATATERVRMPEAVKIQMESVSLFVKRVCLNPAATALMDKSLATGGHLQYQRLQTIAFQCAKGMQTWNWRNCFNNLAPQRAFVALVTQEAYHGSLARTSTFLESANVASVRFILDGREIMAEPYQTKFAYNSNGVIDTEETQAIPAFHGLCNTMGVITSVRNNFGITYDNFIDGATVFAVDLGYSDSTQVVSGSFDVCINFAQPCEEPYMVIVMGEFPKILSFDANRKISPV